MKRPPPPPSMLRVVDLIGVRPVSRAQADRNWSHRVNPASERVGTRGLSPYTEAAELWAAVACGEWPPPVRTPDGLRWPLESVVNRRRK